MLQRYLLVQETTGFVVLKSVSFPARIWVECTVRKDHRCAVCDEDIEKGQQAHRPVTNGNNRMHRICPTCITAIRSKR